MPVEKITFLNKSHVSNSNQKISLSSDHIIILAVGYLSWRERDGWDFSGGLF